MPYVHVHAPIYLVAWQLRLVTSGNYRDGGGGEQGEELSPTLYFSVATRCEISHIVRNLQSSCEFSFVPFGTLIFLRILSVYYTRSVIC